MENLLETDIYELTEAVKNLEERYIDEEDPDTLAIGIYGYLADIHATLLQNSIITTSEMGNELFPARAKFERNVISHAVIQNIENINAVPATISAILGIFEEDFDKYMRNDKFYIDKEIPFGIEEFEFHLEYDVLVQRTVLPNNKYAYSAMYDMSVENPLSKITNPYLQAPFMQLYNGKTMIFFYIELMQVHHETFNKTLITNNLVENKTIIFQFQDQLADFTVRVTDGDEQIYLTPVFEGMGVENDIKNFCYYSYIDLNNIRVTFDSISYLPGINALIEAEIWTTLGSEGNFSFFKNFNTTLSSDNYGYKNIPMRVMIGTESSGGIDKKSIEELRNLIPKEALSRGSITNTTTLTNYFNMINTEDNRLEIMKRVDNQFERSYFAYMVLKDSYNNVIPTNTVDLEMDAEQFQTKDNRKYALLPGTCLYLDRESGVCTIISDEERIQELIKDDKETFVYGLPLMVVMTDDPLYISYYSTIIDYSAYLDFKYINYTAPLQFVAPSITWKRQFTVDRNKYKLTIPYTQNVQADMGVLQFDSNTHALLKNNMKVFVVFYNAGETTPYRYAEAFMEDYEYGMFYFTYLLELTTTDQIDDHNMIRIEGLKIPGTDDEAYGYMSSNVTARIYVLNKFTNSEYGRYDLDEVVPGLEGYTVCNMFEVNNGLNFYESYTDIINSIVKHITYRDENNILKDGYQIKSIPVVRYSYMDDESCIQEFIDELNYKKVYIDNALYVLENNFTIDFKLFNTYGPSKIYSLDSKGEQLVSRVNLTLNFRLRLIQSTDSYTVNYIIRDIKEILEDLNDISSLHIPNLITTITNTYRNSIEYFEFLGINDYGPGVQHLYKNETDDVSVVPEFLTVHTNEDLSPDINIELA